MGMDAKVIIADLQLLTAACMYGFGFSAQRAAMIEGMGPLTFNACRYVVSMLVLAFMMPVLTSRAKDKDEDEAKESLVGDKDNMTEPQKAWLYGTILSFFALGATTFQQIGIQYISASEAAFVTGFYIVFTPFLALLFPVLAGGTKPKWNTWVAVAGSMLGLFIISDASLEDLELGKGETLTMISAFFWTLHIMFTDYATSQVDAIYCTFTQFIATATTSSLLSWWNEYNEWNISHIYNSWLVIVLLGVMECFGFTIGAIGQTNAPSFHAAIIYGSEAVFATVGGFFFLDETFTLREWIGCALMLTSTIVAKIDFEVEPAARKSGTD